MVGLYSTIDFLLYSIKPKKKLFTLHAFSLFINVRGVELICSFTKLKTAPYQLILIVLESEFINAWYQFTSTNFKIGIIE